MFKTIPIGEVDYYIENDMMVIDLRNAASYQIAHINGAVNIPYEEIDQRISELPRDKILVFYCARGGQSMMVCRYLSRMGYSVLNVANGIAYYRGKYLVRG
ncbi:rhodanese-like domain-containing protein [Hungatella hathewayi]